MKLLRNQRGQGMTEYIIIVALIAIAAIAAFSFFGRTVRDQTAAVSEELAGGSGKDAQDKAQAAADKAVTDADKNKTLETYVDEKDASK